MRRAKAVAELANYKSKSSGAKSALISKRDRIKAWKRHHQQVAVDSFQRLYRQPFAALSTMSAIAIALSLPALLWLASLSLQTLDQQFDQATQLMVYTPAQLPQTQLTQLLKQTESLDNVANVKVIDAAQGLKELEQSLGIQNAIALLDENPLPTTFVITPREISTSAMNQLLQNLQNLPNVSEVQLDTVWLERLTTLRILLQRFSWGLMVLFGCGVLLVCGNTIRLEVERRRDEIKVMGLLGATSAFIRRPFIYEGVWLGLGGGILALLFIFLALSWLKAPAARLLTAQDFLVLFPRLTVTYIAGLLLCSMMLGFIGAWLAVSRHLFKARYQ